MFDYVTLKVIWWLLVGVLLLNLMARALGAKNRQAVQ